jgi:hypothetical protein
MQAENVMQLVWPGMNGTVPIIAVALALAIFVFGAFSGARANKIRVFFAVCLATVIGWFAMPLAIRAASAVHLADTQSGVVILISAMMFLVAAVATSLYEVITVTFPDIGMSPRS